ncbi:MAG TPA: TIGR04282 family arsenosugar biosynthesis glycosyltransferase [Solirubrobacteraceae bacterium]|nr:TIGR04282 family arsenosugar biosynthesis glycosyltransferase [Solirubrobacteraceae bacterium]
MSRVDPALLVIAKQPLPGRVKTRLCPPCTPGQAAALAAAALQDTLAAISAVPAGRRVLIFEGNPTGIRPDGFDCLPQRGDGLGERLAGAFAEVGTPALLVGMDTPQMTAADLQPGLSALADPDVDAVIGPTDDGGYWCIGLARPLPGTFTGVTMSSERTYAEQLTRLHQLGARVRVLGRLRDVDTFADATHVAAGAPRTRFARAVAALTQSVPELAERAA